MNVNDLFNQIGNFWRSISIPILFHFIFWGLYGFVFGRYPVKAKLEEYIKSDRFTRTKAILEEFQLWTKLPFLLGILALIYLSIFNNLSNVLTSPRVFPLEIRYTQEVFLREYEPKTDVMILAGYQQDTSITFEQLDSRRSQWIQEYKTRFQEDYNSLVKWLDDAYSERYRYLQLTVLTMAVLVLLMLNNLRRKGVKRKGRSVFRLILVLILGAGVAFVFRYRCEQAIEMGYAQGITFDLNCLRADTSKKLLGRTELLAVWHNLDNQRTSGMSWHPERIWVSRYVAESPVLRQLLGQPRFFREGVEKGGR